MFSLIVGIANAIRRETGYNRLEMITSEGSTISQFQQTKLAQKRFE